MIATEPRVVVVTTRGCHNCRALSPRLEDVAARNPDVEVVRVDAGDRPEAAREWAVRGVPTLIAVREGREVARRMGRIGEEELSALFTTARHGAPDGARSGAGSGARSGAGSGGRSVSGRPVDRRLACLTGLALAVVGVTSGTVALLVIGAAVCAGGWLAGR